MARAMLPDGTFEYGRNGLNSITFVRPGHTTTAPRLLIINRVEAQQNGGGEFSLPTYRVRFIDGHVDAEGNPKAARSHVELVVRQPVDSVDDPIKTSLGYLKDLLADPDFVDDATADLMFPEEYIGE